LRARAVAVRDGRVQAYCSAACKARATADSGEIPIVRPDPPPAEPDDDRGLSMRGVVLTAVIGSAALGFGGKLLDTTPRPPLIAALVPQSAMAMKPERPPTREEAIAMLSPPAGTEDDLWLHPLYGPRRKLPIRNTRRFGAPREGLRPEECRSGHCGVDLGNARGEVVIAVHDGVVERVVRDDDGSKEGRFVRINHKGGTVVSSYMHLEKIESSLHPGVPVKAGDKVGTVGETGVFHSGPHLHFAISVRPSADAPELFIDPEPLLHLWVVRNQPLRARALAALERDAESPAEGPPPPTASP
jgi:hypothetical protein